MARTDVDVVNQAIGLIGGEPIEALGEDTPLGAWAQTAYPFRRDYLMSLYEWRFLTAFAQLARMATAPPGCPLKYCYALPSDLVGDVRAFRRAPDAHAHVVRVLVSSLGAASDAGQVFAEYTAAKPESTWPPWFVTLTATAFASDVARRRPDAAVADTFWQQAFGPPEQGGEGGLYLQARQADGRNAPERQLFYDAGPLVDARMGGFYPTLAGRPLIVDLNEPD